MAAAAGAARPWRKRRWSTTGPHASCVRVEREHALTLDGGRLHEELREGGTECANAQRHKQRVTRWGNSTHRQLHDAKRCSRCGPQADTRACGSTGARRAEADSQLYRQNYYEKMN